MVIWSVLLIFASIPLIKPKSVAFDLTVDSMTSSLCHAAYDTEDNCTGKQNNESCWCDHKDKNILVYKYSFLFNRTIHKGGQMECKLCIQPKYQLIVTVTGSCNGFKDDFASGGRRGTSRTELTVARVALFSISVIQLLPLLCY